MLESAPKMKSVPFACCRGSISYVGAKHAFVHRETAWIIYVDNGVLCLWTSVCVCVCVCVPVMSGESSTDCCEVSLGIKTNMVLES